MKLSDGTSVEPGDSEVVRRLNEHGDAIERALPSISGSEIRRALPVASSPTRVTRNRTPFLVAAAVAALVVGGGIAMLTLGRADSDTRLEASPTATTEVEEAEQPDPETPTEVTEPERDPATSTGAVDLTPIPVTPAEFGTAEVRFLPAADSGFAVASGSRVLLSTSDLAPTVATPVRTQRLAMPAADPTDRRAVMVLVSTYATEADVDAFLEDEPTAHGDVGEPADFDGRQGTWFETEGFAPFSAGTPMRTIRTLRLHLDPTTVVDVAAPDVSRAEIEALVASLTFADDGSLESPPAPAGFEEAQPIDGLSPGAVINDPSAADQLSLTLVGANGEQVELTISPDSAGLDPAGAHHEDPSGYGWIEFGLFREVVVSFVSDDVTLELRSFNGQMSADEMLELARSVEPVDDDSWAERLAVASLFDAPVADVGDLPAED